MFGCYAIGFEVLHNRTCWNPLAGRGISACLRRQHKRAIHNNGDAILHVGVT